MSSDVDVCSKFSDNFIVSSKTIKCSSCTQLFHPVCVGLKDNISKVVIESDNLFWFCDECKVDIFANITRKTISAVGTAVMQKEIEGMRNELELCKKLINEQFEVNSLQKSKILQLETDNVNKPLFSHVVASISKSKFNVNIPDNDSGVILINSETQNAKEVMASVQSKIKPSELNISVNKTRPIKNGMLINCSKKNIPKVKEIISSKLGNEYTVREGTKRNPRIRISGVDSKTASKDTFIDEMFNQTEQLKSVSTDGVKWVFSKKWHNTVDVFWKYLLR
nr:unnamed protein product [Callosobruchus chinensis]